MLASAARTGRVLVAHEAVQVAGFGAEIAATIAEHTGARVARLGAPRVPVGYARGARSAGAYHAAADRAAGQVAVAECAPIIGALPGSSAAPFHNTQETHHGSPHPTQDRPGQPARWPHRSSSAAARSAQGKYKAEYRLSTVVGTAFPWGKGAEIWINLVKERTQGRINIKMYPGVSLINGDQTREFSAIRQGVIDMAVGSTINWSPQVRELNLFSLPFLARTMPGIDAMTQGAVGKQIMQIVEKAGVMPLAWGENGFREVTNSKHEIRTPADMAGLKFRVVGSPIFNDTFTALGANPTQMSWADAQPALASGAVEGQENPLHIFTAAKLQNLGQKFVTLLGLCRRPADFRRQQGRLELVDTGRPRDSCSRRRSKPASRKS